MANEIKKRKSGDVTNFDPDGYNVMHLSEDSFKAAEHHRMQQARKDLLTEQLNKLGGGCKEVLQLSFKAKTVEEVAIKLNMTNGYVRKKKSLCMAKLIALVRNSSGFNDLKY